MGEGARRRVRRAPAQHAGQPPAVERLALDADLVACHLDRRTLAEFLAHPATRGFVRVHRSHAVNAAHIVAIASLPRGEAQLTLSSGQQLRVSRESERAFLLSVSHELKTPIGAVSLLADTLKVLGTPCVNVGPQSPGATRLMMMFCVRVAKCSRR